MACRDFSEDLQNATKGSVSTVSSARRKGWKVAIETIFNLRDIGGWPTRDGGRVRSGLLYRSAALSRIEPQDEAAFASYRIRVVYDLRTPDESAIEPDRLPGNTELVELDVLADSTGMAPARLIELMSDPLAARRSLIHENAEEMFKNSYREMITLPSAVRGFRRLFESLSDPDLLPALVHCTTGKDRTGWAAASMLMLLGVPDDLVKKEYLLTNEQLIPALRPLMDNFRSFGVDPSLLLPVIGVREDYLQAGLEEMIKLYGTVDAYFTDGLGLDEATVDALRAIFTEDGGPPGL